MRLEFSALLPPCTILPLVIACNNSSAPIFNGSSGGQTAASSSSVGGNSATSNTATNAPAGGAQQSTNGSTSESNGGASTVSSSSNASSSGGSADPSCEPLLFFQGGAYFESCSAVRGGTSAKGGAASGGTVSTATTNSARGGGGASGGSQARGGGSGAGGGSATVTSPNAGGTSSTGDTSSAGGSTSDVCAWDAGPKGTDGALTCYWFSQGTAKDETTCPGGYKTYCGYCGGETGSKPTTGQNWCPINDIANSVKNISTTHFVAIPPGPLGNGKNCGACVEVNYMGRSIVATVIDSCPSCTSDQHIDLSLSAAKALGMTELMGEVKQGSGVSWRIVGCPASTNIAVSYNGSAQSQIYFQNLAFPIAKAAAGGKEATVNTGFWDFGMPIGGQEVTLTDVMGHTIGGKVPSGAGTLGVQFPLTCN